MRPLFSFALLLLYCSCYTNNRECEQFHKGTFEFKTIVGDKILKSIFVRDTRYEVETFEGKIDSASIRWINSCECVLTKIHPSSNQDKRPVSIKILSTSKNRYVFEYALVGDSNNKQRGTIYKIKN
tara:strand:+ start:4947 stop:5324 length:378 start_codon:yes stop_codon:yes gene_type:complete